MSAFTGPLSITELDKDWRLWQLLTPLNYDIGELGSGNSVVVPAGFITDGASIPQLLWSVLPAWGKWSRAAVVHDYLCCRIALAIPHPSAKTYDDAADILWEAMSVLEVGRFARACIWLGVVIANKLNISPQVNINEFNKELLLNQ